MTAVRQQSHQPDHAVPAIVLCKAATGLATVRALASEGVDVHAFVFSPHDPLRWSRYGRKVEAGHVAKDDDALVALLHDYAAALPVRPVVLATCDSLTLLLARHADSLSRVCRLSTSPLALMRQLVCKDQLYEVARTAGIPLIPFLNCPDADTLAPWSLQHAGPYLLKPSYESAGEVVFKAKNLRMADRDALLAYEQAHGLHGVVVQQLKLGGDGEIYDTYGFSDERGQVLSIASHQRLRQQRPDLGSTCYGEIPAYLPQASQQHLFDLTEQLLRVLPYHGIFGIEWLRDGESGAFYLIDFNARPFLCIGHLYDCGLNLPLIAYRNLCQQVQPDLPQKPSLLRKRWLDFNRDLDARRTRQGVRRPGTLRWLRTLAQASSFAYWDWMDPGPWVFNVLRLAEDASQFALRVFMDLL
jgi:D-aspartate ligase